MSQLMSASNDKNIIDEESLEVSPSCVQKTLRLNIQFIYLRLDLLLSL